MAASMESASRMSPATASQCSWAMFSRLALGRISTRTVNPRATSARATAEPTKPDAPVTRATSDMGFLFGRQVRESFAAFDSLPVQQRRHSQHNLPRPLEQGYRDAHFGGKAKHRRQHGIAPLLHP